MDFSVEIANFPSTVHRCIYCEARGVMPLERSLEGVDDSELRASCSAYRAFYIGLLEDMYEAPEAYGLPVGEMEAFLGGRKLNGMKRRHPARAKTLLARTRNAVQGYLSLLFLLGQRGMWDGQALIVAPEDLAEIGRKTSTSVSPIPLETRLRALERRGFVLRDGGFVCGAHPGMFPALCAMARNAGRQSGFGYFAFTTADFRALADPKHRPDHEDYFRPLTEKQCEQARALHVFALENGLRPAINTFFKVDYKYRGIQVMCVGSEGDRERLLDVRIVCAYHWDDHALINRRLEREPPDFQKRALRRVWRCDACATTHLGRFVTVLGKKQRVCGGGLIGFRWRNPEDAELADIRRMIELRKQIIDELKA